MEVLITQPRGKEDLCKAFTREGCELVTTLSPKTRLVVPTVDEELWFFARHREWFRERDITVAISPEFAVSTCRDKADFFRFCRRHEFGTPETAQYEALVKPRFGKGSKGQFRIDRSMIVQEVVTWPEYSVDYFKLGDLVSIIPRLRQNVVNGEAKSGTIVYDEKLSLEAERLGQELGLEYHNVMQCFYDGYEIKWIEVNCRYGGGSWISFDEFNSPRFLVESLKENGNEA